MISLYVVGGLVKVQRYDMTCIAVRLFVGLMFAGIVLCMGHSSEL
jgi:hypothetical protein